MPPSPNTTAVAPGSTLAVLMHRADPGGHAAADVADLVEGRVLAHLRHRDLRQHGEVREGRAAHVVEDRLAIEREKREVPSGISPWPWVARIAVQRLVLRDEAGRALPAFRRVERDDVVALLDRWSRPRRPRPRRPRPRGRGSPGRCPRDRRPSRVNSSVWQMPVALISTITSPAFGPSRSTSVISSGLPASNATAARVFIRTLPSWIALGRHCSGGAPRAQLHQGATCGQPGSLAHDSAARPTRDGIAPRSASQRAAA